MEEAAAGLPLAALLLCLHLNTLMINLTPFLIQSTVPVQTKFHNNL